MTTTREKITPYTRPEFWLKKGAFCSLSFNSPGLTVYLAREYLARTKGPLSVKHLDHYLEGSGKTIEIDIVEFFKANDNLFDLFVKHVSTLHKEGRKTGQIPFSQAHFDGVKDSEDWRNATGSVNIHWIIKDEYVCAGFENKYQWHPTDFRRTTQCVHGAMEFQKAFGAKDYNMVAKEKKLFPVHILSPKAR